MHKLSMRDDLIPLASELVIWRSFEGALGSFDVIRETRGLWDRQPVLAHPLQVKFNRFTHASSQLVDGFSGGDAPWQVRQVSRIVTLSRFDDHCVPHNDRLYFFSPPPNDRIHRTRRTAFKHRRIKLVERHVTPRSRPTNCSTAPIWTTRFSASSRKSNQHSASKTSRPRFRYHVPMRRNT